MNVQGGPAPVTMDPVTGAHSRAALDVALHDVAGCSLLLFDVDHFKTVNDAFGHLRGDLLLRQLADRIAELIRTDDVLFRYGGDEFVLLLPNTGADEALRLAIRLTDEIRARSSPGPRRCTCRSASAWPPAPSTARTARP
ncbi:hypothetical protein GCM10027610_126190 [Dactylosporangium cerinum]